MDTVRQTSSFGALLRRYREERGFSQEALAAQAGLSVASIGALERGVTQWPYRDTVARLASALGLAPAERRALEGAARRPVRRSTRPREPAPVPPSTTAAGRGGAPPLPLPSTPLIGRADELDYLKKMLVRPGTRLVTVTGPGGIGKTRLALEVAHCRGGPQGALADGVVFVELAGLQEGVLLPMVLARALGVRDTPGRALHASLAAHIGQRSLLVVLDNCEHVLAACATLVVPLLGACPHLRVLATSRAGLRVRGEQQYALAPLALPDPAQASDPEVVGRAPAAHLFVQRAQAAEITFALTPENAAAVAAICVRLDGIPLALELAAARITLLPPGALLARLERRLAVLVGGARDLPARQQTLRATLDWSYNLLGPDEQALFARLGVFAGGRSLEAIEAICNPEGTLDVLAGLEALVANSLLEQAELDDTARFTMRETIQEYARERLAARGETAALRAAHAASFLTLAEAAAPHLRGAEQARWLGRLEREHDNLRAALAWALEGDTALGLRLGGALWRFWQTRGYLSEGRRWLDAVLGASGAEPSRARAQALRGAGALADYQGDYLRAAALHEEALALCRALGDVDGVALSLGNLGDVACEQGDYGRAAALLEEALALRRELGDKVGIASALNSRANVAHDQGDYGRATALHEEALALRRELGDTYGIAGSLNNLANVAHDQGDDGRATVLHEEALARRRELGDSSGIAMSLHNLGRVASEQGDYGRAAALLEEALALRRALGDLRGSASSLDDLANVAHDQGDYGRATILQEEALALCRSIGQKRLSVQCLEGLASIAAAQGQPERATRLFGAAAAARRLINAPLPPNERARVERLAAAARAQLAPGALAAAWAAGQALSLEQAIAEALHEQG